MSRQSTSSKSKENANHWSDSPGCACSRCKVIRKWAQKTWDVVRVNTAAQLGVGMWNGSRLIPFKVHLWYDSSKMFFVCLRKINYQASKITKRDCGRHLFVTYIPSWEPCMCPAVSSSVKRLQPSIAGREKEFLWEGSGVKWARGLVGVHPVNWES